MVLFCETSSRMNFVNIRYMRLQVEVDLRKSIPSGFLHKLEGRKIWIQFQYEHMAEVCYKCGVIGHSKVTCGSPKISSHLEGGDLYGPWIRAEANMFTVVSEGLRRVEIPRREIFYSLHKDLN